MACPQRPGFTQVLTTDGATGVAFTLYTLLRRFLCRHPAAKGSSLRRDAPHVFEIHKFERLLWWPRAQDKKKPKRLKSDST